MRPLRRSVRVHLLVGAAEAYRNSGFDLPYCSWRKSNANSKGAWAPSAIQPGRPLRRNVSRVTVDEASAAH